MDLKTGVELRLKFVPGRTALYSLKTQLDQQVQQGEQVVNETENVFTNDLRQRVLAVDPDETAHILCMLSPPGADPRGEQRQIIYQRLGPRGEVLDVSGLNPANAFALPEGSVSEGSSWTGEVKIPIPQSPETVACTTTYELKGSREVEGMQCVEISCSVDEFEFGIPMPDRSGRAIVLMGSHGTIYFAPEEGILVRYELDTVTSPQIGQFSFTTSTTITQEFVRFEDLT